MFDDDDFDSELLGGLQRQHNLRQNHQQYEALQALQNAEQQKSFVAEYIVNLENEWNNFDLLSKMWVRTLSNIAAKKKVSSLYSDLVYESAFLQSMRSHCGSSLELRRGLEGAVHRVRGLSDEIPSDLQIAYAESAELIRDQLIKERSASFLVAVKRGLVHSPSFAVSPDWRSLMSHIRDRFSGLGYSVEDLVEPILNKSWNDDPDISQQVKDAWNENQNLERTPFLLFTITGGFPFDYCESEGLLVADSTFVNSSKFMALASHVERRLQPIEAVDHTQISHVFISECSLTLHLDWVNYMLGWDIGFRPEKETGSKKANATSSGCLVTACTIPAGLLVFKSLEYFLA